MDLILRRPRSKPPTWGKAHGCGSKPMVPFLGFRCTTHFRTYLSGDWLMLTGGTIWLEKPMATSWDAAGEANPTPGPGQGRGEFGPIPRAAPQALLAAAALSRGAWEPEAGGEFWFWGWFVLFFYFFPLVCFCLFWYVVFLNCVDYRNPTGCGKTFLSGRMSMIRKI